MISVRGTAGKLKELTTSITFDDFAVSWASGSLWKLGEFCFGSEDGKIVFTDAEGNQTSEAQSVSPSGEAVNGVAFIDRWMSVSTRSEVVCLTVPAEQDSELIRDTLHIGSHGVIAATGNEFVAPVGNQGILFFKANAKKGEFARIIHSNTNRIYYYKINELISSTGEQTINCALRGQGIGALRFRRDDEQPILSRKSYPGLDVVDVCPIFDETRSMGVAAIANDGTLILDGHTLEDEALVTINYEDIRGTVYRIASASKHIFVLTSRGLYIIDDLIEFIQSEENGNPITPVLFLPVEAVDMNVVTDQWLLIILPDQVLRLNISLLDQLGPNDPPNGQFRKMRADFISPSWSRQDVVQDSQLLPAGI